MNQNDHRSCGLGICSGGFKPWLRIFWLTIAWTGWNYMWIKPLIWFSLIWFAKSWNPRGWILQESSKNGSCSQALEWQVSSFVPFQLMHIQDHLPIQISESLAAAHMLGVPRPLKGACLVFVEAPHFHRQTTLFHDVEPRGISYCKDRHQSCSPSSFRGLALFLWRSSYFRTWSWCRWDTSRDSVSHLGRLMTWKD